MKKIMENININKKQIAIILIAIVLGTIINHIIQARSTHTVKKQIGGSTLTVSSNQSGDEVTMDIDGEKYNMDTSNVIKVCNGNPFATAKKDPEFKKYLGFIAWTNNMQYTQDWCSENGYQLTKISKIMQDDYSIRLNKTYTDIYRFVKKDCFAAIIQSTQTAAKQYTFNQLEARFDAYVPENKSQPFDRADYCREYFDEYEYNTSAAVKKAMDEYVRRYLKDRENW